MELLTKNHGGKRGRPRMLSDGGELRIRTVYGDASRRVIQERAYGARALSLLKGKDEYRWLCEERSCGKLPKTILSALGRIEDEELLLETAAELCEVQPPTWLGLRMIRQARREMEGESQRAVKWLIQAMNRYLAKRPQCGADDMARALEAALELVQAGESEGA